MDEPIGAALGRRAGHRRPVTVGNGADLAALAEHARGVAVGCDNVIYLHGDVGVGGGIIAGGRRLTGHGGYGGEVGHMVVNPQGRPCGCGSRGCWETEIGEYALLRAAGRSDGTGAGTRCCAVVDAADRGDAMAQTALRQVGDWLGFGVANLVNIFNPEMVIFGGTMRDVYLASAAQVRGRLNRWRSRPAVSTCGCARRTSATTRPCWAPPTWPSNGCSPTRSTWADPCTLSGVDVELRASDDDRNRVVAALHQHTAAGRLTLDEFSDRAGAVWTARTLGDLAALTRDYRPAHSAVDAGPVGRGRQELLMVFAAAALTLLLLGGLLAVTR